MEAEFLYILSLITLVLIGFMAIRTGKRSKSKRVEVHLPPGPRKLPIIGNMHLLAGYLPHRRLADLAKKHGPLMHLQLGEVCTVVVSSAEAAKEVMKTHDSVLADRPFLLAPSIISYNLKDIAFATYGEYWRQLRKICNLELLSPSRVQLFRPIRGEEMSNLVSYVSSNAGSSINLSKIISSTNFSITSRAAFGNKCNDIEKFISCVKEAIVLTGGFSPADVFPSYKWLHSFGGIKRKIVAVHELIDEILERIIEEHKAWKTDRSKSNLDEYLVDVLLKFQRGQDFSLENDDIKAVLLDIFSAGSETSSTAVEWAMTEMLRNPRIMGKAQAEARQVFNGNGNVDESRLGELKYLKLIVKETLRMHPPAPLLLPRECRQKCEIFGYTIPEKTRIIVNAWAIGRDPNHWEDPDTFFPERFLDNSTDYKGGNFEFIPFGAGRRICPGIAFGIVNVELPLANLLFHFDWMSPDNTNLEDQDMSEVFGATVRRKTDLCLIPVLYHPPSAA